METIKRVFKTWLVYAFLFLILAGALFVRVYRVGDLLQFYYDQGRDALVIWDLWHKGKPFLIGPVTGLKGIFLGPLYYYLIAPFYLIGEGNPVYPAVFLALLGTLAVLLIFVLGVKMHSKVAGIIAATITGFSYAIATFNRWLSNPNPILLTSLIFMWALWEILESKTKRKRFWWIIASLMVGISLQFESASAVFYIPIFVIFFLWQVLTPRGILLRPRKDIAKSPKHPRGVIRLSVSDFKTVILVAGAFFITLLPQIIFNFRHDNILFNNFKALFLEERAFRPFTKFILEERFKYFWNVFSGKLFPGWREYAIIFITVATSIFISSYKNFKREIIPLFAIFLITPMVGYIFFQGNYGNIYDYYMSGYYLPFILLFSLAMGELWTKKLGKAIVLIFMFLFLSTNGRILKNYLTSAVMTRPISLEEQIHVVNWVLDDLSAGRQMQQEFNVDVYVPPVIPYAYDYLFLWQATKRCGENLCGMVKEPVTVFYTLYEPDTDHPERIEAWFKRQNGIGRVEEEYKYGHITVQRRRRL